MKFIFLNLTASRITPDMEKYKGMGASDAFIMHVTRALVEKGHEVKLYANTSFSGMNEGVRWENYIDRDLCEECDVLVVNRGAISIENFKPKKMIYYSHDNTDAPVMKGIEEFFEKPDVIVAVSEWHKTRLLDLAWEKGVDLRPEKIVVVGNGLAFPPSRVVLKDFAACYCSIPFKGLHVLATIWPRIKEAVPGLKLHVCSGMSMYGMDSHDMYYENVYEALRADPDVVFHGVLTNEGVRDVMAGCSLMIYPNTFPETFCVAAYESISVGTPVISSDLAALPTTVADCGVLIKGDPEFPGMATKTAYHEEMISVLKDILVDHPEKLDLLRLKCYDRKMRTWKDVADDLERISMEALNGN